MMMYLSRVSDGTLRAARQCESASRRSFERVDFEFGEDAALGIQQQRERATAFVEIFDVVGDDGVQVAQAIRPREIDNGVPVGIEDRERFARGAVFVFEGRESLGQHAAVIGGELGAGGLMQLDQWRFDEFAHPS